MPARDRGFTLVELLVVIVILAILGVVGTVVFTNVQKGARDARRKADVEAIYLAFENKNTATGGYVDVIDTDFATGKIPADPTSKGNYFRVVANDKSGFKVCASLDANPSNQCNSQAANCYCKVSTQSSVTNTQSSNLSGDSSSILLGYGSQGSSSSCDTNGTLSSGLVGHWRLDETGTPATFTDSSGNGNHGASTTGATSTIHTPDPLNIFQNAASFDGIDDRIIATPSKTGRNFVTISGWVNFDNPDNVNQIDDYHTLFGWELEFNLVFRTYTSEPGAGYFFQPRGTTANGGTSNVGKAYPIPAKLSGWHFLAATYDGADVTMYFDGSSMGSQAIADTGIKDFGSSNTFHIGDRSTSGGLYYWDGQLDDVRLYYRALSPQEISTLYNSGNGCIP